MFAAQHRRLLAAQRLPDDLDALLVTSLVNVRYLTGLDTSHAAVLVPRDGEPTLATDGRYLGYAAEAAPDLHVVPARAVGPELVSLAARAGVRRLGIERDHVTIAGQEPLTAVAGDDVVLAPVSGLVEGLRVRKDAEELALLAEACRITDAALDAVLPQLRPGLTERDVAWLLESEMRTRGAAGVAFDSIVAGGPNSAVPHHHPTTRELRSGELLKLDFGARYDGYHADMTRTVALAPVAEWQQELHALVREVQREAVAATTVGATPSDLNDLAAGRITAAGYPVAHGLGHGVGLEIHEAPFLTPGSTADRLEPDVPVTVEPGVYLPGRGGVRIEDTVVVRAAGAESLTTTARDLIEIG